MSNALSESSPLRALTAVRPTLVVFLRHFGCTFCREALADVAAARPAIDAAGTPLAFVHMGSPEDADPWFGRAGLDDVPRLSDPSGAIYRDVGLETVATTTFASPLLWARGFQCAILDGHGFGAQTSQAVGQLPGVFLMHEGRILREYRHRSPADRPDYLALVGDGERAG